MKLTKAQEATLQKIQDEVENLSTELLALANELRDVWGEKSTKWQESEKGAHANDWIETFENASEMLVNAESDVSSLEAEDNA